MSTEAVADLGVRISEAVDREEAAVNAEHPEPEPEPGPEPAPEPTEPPEPVSSITDAVERDKKLKSEDTRHENALKKIHGDDFDQHAFCPLCIGQGFLVPIPPGQQSDEIWEAITALSGRIPASEYTHPDELVMCERCNGWGNVATTAKNEHNAVIPCKLCDSRGYFDLSDPIHRGKLGLNQVHAEPPAPQFPIYHTQQPPAPSGDVLQPPSGWHASGKPGADQYDRWPGHPRYGIDPANNGGVW